MEGLYTQGQEGKDISERRSGHSRMSADTCEFLHQTKHSNQDQISLSSCIHSGCLLISFFLLQIFKSRSLSLVIIFHFIISLIITIIMFCVKGNKMWILNPSSIFENKMMTPRVCSKYIILFWKSLLMGLYADIDFWLDWGYCKSLVCLGFKAAKWGETWSYDLGYVWNLLQQISSKISWVGTIGATWKWSDNGCHHRIYCISIYHDR